MKRLLEPAEVAAAAAWLLGPDGRAVTGRRSSWISAGRPARRNPRGAGPFYLWTRGRLDR